MKEIIKNLPTKKIYNDALSPAVKKVGLIFEKIINLTMFYHIDYADKRLNRFYENLGTVVNRFEGDDINSIVKPANEIARPILTRFEYVESSEIRDMFSKLLYSASHNKHINKAHPSFISVIDNLAIDEARILKYMHTTKRKYLKFVSYNSKSNAVNGILYKNGRATICTELHCNLLYPKMIDFYLDNLIQLGLLHSSTLLSQTSHKLVNYKQDIKDLQNLHFSKIIKHPGLPDIIEGGFGRTEFCEIFMDACLD